jgi:hypothetical protein
MKVPVLVLAAIACASLPCFSQEQMEIAVLTEPVVQKMIPLVKVAAAERAGQAARLESALSQMEKAMVATGRDGKPITSGADILDAFHARSAAMSQPDGATFLPLLSKQLFDQTGILFAIFTLGAQGDPVVISEYEKIQTDKDSSSHAESLVLRVMEDSPAKEAALDLLRQTDEFYTGNGWERTSPSDPENRSWKSPDGQVMVEFHDFNEFTRVEAKLGERSPTGPVLWAGVLRPKRGPAAENPMDVALRKAGMEQKDFTRCLDALLIARDDSTHEKDLDNPVPPGFPELPPDAPKEVVAQLNEAKAGYIKQMAPLFAIRKANLKIYRRHAAELDAPLASLSPGG